MGRLFAQIVQFCLSLFDRVFQTGNPFQIFGVVAFVAVAHFPAFFQGLFGVLQALLRGGDLFVVDAARYGLPA